MSKTVFWTCFLLLILVNWFVFGPSLNFQNKPEQKGEQLDRIEYITFKSDKTFLKIKCNQPTYMDDHPFSDLTILFKCKPEIFKALIEMSEKEI